MPFEVFINYRGEDSQVWGALLYRALSERFGRSRVFLDSSSIRPGDDFEQVISGRLRRSSVVLAVIGPHWLTVVDSAGRRRIDLPYDWVRRELVDGLALGTRVIPVLTDDAELPAEHELPADLAALGRRQYLRVRRRHCEEDLARLVDGLESYRSLPA